MKTVTILAALLIGTTANAFPAHQPNGYRDTGCDAAAQTPVKNDKGEILYWNNPTCNGGNSGNGAEQLARLRELLDADN